MIEFFAEARDRFVNALSEQGKLQYSGCSTVKDLLESLQALAARSKQNVKWTRTFERITAFSDRLQPYFQINPEWSAIAWGALRLVLRVSSLPRRALWRLTCPQLASNFTTFFEKLSELVEKYTSCIPRYADVLEFGEQLVSQDFAFHSRAYTQTFLNFSDP